MAGLMRMYIRRPDGRVEECFDINEHAEWFNTSSDRQLARSAVPYGDLKKAVIVSTVFLGFDFSSGEEDPILFETEGSFPNEEPVFRSRYATEEEARVGHDRMVRHIGELLEELEKNRPATTLMAGRKLPDPECPKCLGKGIAGGAFLGFDNHPCDCTFVPKDTF